MSEHTGGPDCPACEDIDSDIETALTVLENTVGPDMPYREDTRFRLIGLLAQIEGMIPPLHEEGEDPEHDDPEGFVREGSPPNQSN